MMIIIRRRLWIVCCVVLLSACGGQTIPPTVDFQSGGTLPPRYQTALALPSATSRVVEIPTATPAPHCTDATQAKAVAQHFLDRYNAGDVEGVMKLLDANLYEYLDAANSFQATAKDLPKLRAYLTTQFALHDHIVTTDITAHIEPSRVLVQYYALMPNVTRTTDALTGGKPLTGPIQMGIQCDTLQFNTILLQTN